MDKIKMSSLYGGWCDPKKLNGDSLILKARGGGKEKVMKDLHDFSSLYPSIIAPNNMEVVKVDKSINQLCDEAYKIAKSKGWHDNPIEMGTILALIHSEVSEALEADRKGDYNNFVEELADICIRVFHLCGSMGIDLNKAIEEKMEVNKTRPYKHGKKY